MPAVLVINPKGGSGKTTLATNLAGYFASCNESVTLWDLDRQRSALNWLEIRPLALPAIRQLVASEEGASRLRNQREWLILDSAAGIHGKRLTQTLRLADKVIVPVQPSVFDMVATRDFFEVLREEKVIRKHKAFAAVVGMRADPRTRAAATLVAFLEQFDLPVLTHLRDTQIYANAAFTGRCLFDLPPYLNERDAEQWQPLIEWVREQPPVLV
ncbi:MAG: ParA family protein [Burkholderiales bacterium]|nr:ParA family protein [Burkholderiales bacterium]